MTARKWSAWVVETLKTAVAVIAKRAAIAPLILCGGLMAAPSALAVGLGEISVNSSLNEPLNASIALLSSEDLQDGQILVSLASPEAFDSASADSANPRPPDHVAPSAPGKLPRPLMAESSKHGSCPKIRHTRITDDCAHMSPGEGSKNESSDMLSCSSSIGRTPTGSSEKTSPMELLSDAADSARCASQSDICSAPGSCPQSSSQATSSKLRLRTRDSTV